MQKVLTHNQDLFLLITSLFNQPFAETYDTTADLKVFCFAIHYQNRTFGCRYLQNKLQVVAMTSTKNMAGLSIL